MQSQSITYVRQYCVGEEGRGRGDFYTGFVAGRRKRLIQGGLMGVVPQTNFLRNDYRTGRKFRGVFNFAFFVGGCRTRKLKPAKGFVYACACEIVTHPNSAKFTTREIFQIRQNIELHENFTPSKFSTRTVSEVQFGFLFYLIRNLIITPLIFQISIGGNPRVPPPSL